MKYVKGIILNIRRERRQKEGSAISKGCRMEPAALRSQDPAART